MSLVGKDGMTVSCEWCIPFLAPISSSLLIKTDCVVLVRKSIAVSRFIFSSVQWPLEAPRLVLYYIVIFDNR